MILCQGWKKDLTAVNDKNEFPQELNDYVSYIENATGVKIKVVSVGPDRTQTINL